jgi:hypothetical protein
VCKISNYAKIFDLTCAISGGLQAEILKAVSLTTIRHCISLVNTITYHNCVHKVLLFHDYWRHQARLLCNKVLASIIVSVQLDEAISLAVACVAMGTEWTKFVDSYQNYKTGNVLRPFRLFASWNFIGLWRNLTHCGHNLFHSSQLLLRCIKIPAGHTVRKEVIGKYQALVSCIQYNILFFLWCFDPITDSTDGASRSHSDTPHSVGLLWTKDWPFAETSDNAQYSQETNIHVPCGIRT